MLPENICEIILWTVIGHILAETPLSKLDFTTQNYSRIKMQCLQAEHSQIAARPKHVLLLFLEAHSENSSKLLDYFQTSILNLAARLKQTSEQDTLCSLL